MDPPKTSSNNIWLPEHLRWLKILPKDQHPCFAYIPKDFEGPSLAKDGINLLIFVKDKKASVLDGRNYRSTTPKKGRTKGRSRQWNQDAVYSASIFGNNDQFTNSYEITDDCHLVPHATGTAEGYRIDHCRGNAPGTFCPSSRVNCFWATPTWNSEDQRHYWLIFPIISPENINIPDAIFQLVDYNLSVTPDKRVNILDYFPNLVQPRGNYFLAVSLYRGPGFRLFTPDEEEILPGTPKPRDNGMVFVSHIDMQLAIQHSASIIRYWDNKRAWPERRTPFNPMIQNMISTTRTETESWFNRGVGETHEFWKASMQGKNPAFKIHPVTGLKEIDLHPSGSSSVNPTAAPGHSRTTRKTNSGQIVGPLFDPDHPDCQDPTQTGRTAKRSLSRKERLLERAEAGRIRRGNLYASEVDSSAAEDREGNDDIDSDNEGGAPALSTRHATTPPLSGTEEDEVEAIIVVPRRTARSRTKKNVQPTLSNNSVEDAQAPVRRSSRKQSVATSNADSEDEPVVVPARGRPRARATAIRKTHARGARMETRTDNVRKPVRKGARTRAATKSAPATDNEADREDEAPKVARTSSKRAVSRTTTTENAQAGPGPATVAMRGKKRVKSSPEAQNKDLPKQKKTRGRG